MKQVDKELLEASKKAVQHYITTMYISEQDRNLALTGTGFVEETQELMFVF